MLLFALGIASLSAGLVLLAIRRGHTPGPPRTHYLETEDGERDRPLEELAEGAANSRSRCRECGDVVDFASFQVCESCVAGSVAAD